MHDVRRPRHIGWPDTLAGDKGYSYDHLRQFLADCRIKAVIPRKSNQAEPPDETFDRRTYRKRSMQKYLRILDPSDRA
jgi:hypothetical protein